MEKSAGKLSVLYVEDEAETRELIRNVLVTRFPEASLHVAVDGAEGLALFEEYRPQLVITDIAMPVMDGLTMAGEIRKVDAEVELIALTAYSDTRFLVQAIELGFSHYVFKPIVLSKLVAVVGKAIGAVQLKLQVKEQFVQLQERELQLQATFDQAAVGIAHATLDGTFVRINSTYCDIIGCSPGREAENIYDFTHPGDIPRCRENHELMLEGKTRSYYLEKRYIHSDGSIVWVALTSSLVQDQAGAPMFMVVMINDITNRKELEAEVAALNTTLAARAEELEAANRDLKAFNYTVAHDLRQPLNLINGYCQGIKALCGGSLSEECRDFLQKAYDGTLRMNRLVTALLQFAQTADAEMKYETVDLTSTAEDVAAELKRAEPERNVTFTIAPGMTADGDRQLLHVVLANLLGNAWKYTSERSEALIEFGSRDYGGRQTFFVRDNGMGFTDDEAKEIFIPFRRLAGGQRVGGFGVGLGTVERIIKRHGGKVWAEGEPGKGATFYFTLQ